ncbi:hypothetical protein JDV02_002506 [Purpureocillium takamizusanense]|uniref:Succinate dehydrogenase assembly factor 4, mitochondrial n=1 Tax=Purpureocillium takamizusanense TaxID=2060973 RepID=A0A9Q8QAF9_9HYPO|nr:uncharacterized protein JDV02_002506 [Purpureocillium takamizusanense]UNI16030.1 hypothetical protein JDV02_002506 [Purpureocillium takamizusanense]
MPPRLSLLLPLLPPAARPRPHRLPVLSLAPLANAPGRRPSSSFTPRPSPPKLPADQQAEFERLQRAAAVSSAFQQTPSASATPPSTQQPRHATNPVDAASSSAAATNSASSSSSGSNSDADVNQGMFRGAPPEFDGDVNPKTGEVGGPKNEPLRWGGGGDWSYNGRVTDF